MTDLLALAEDYDAWRANYDELSFSDHKIIYERIRELHPQQRHFTLSQAYPFFDKYRPKSVVELGGWDGWLATCILGQHPELAKWRNFDLVHVPQTCIDPRYKLNVLVRPFWKTNRHAEAFVATHTIEHMRLRELEQLVECLRVKWCLVEAPIDYTPMDWSEYGGTHILEVGWESVDAIFAANGYGIDHEWKHGRYYAR